MVAEKRENRFDVNNQRSFFGFLIAGVITLILIGAASFYWLFGKNNVSIVTTSSQPSAAIFVSKLAPVMVSLLVNPDKLQVLETQGELTEIKNNLLAKTRVDYQQDIKPWLGNEITLAVTSKDLDRDPANGLQPGYLMALSTKKPEKSREFVDLFFSKRALSGANLKVEQYQGVKLIYDRLVANKAAKTTSQNTLAGAVVDNFVLFANDTKVLREAINNVQAPDLNLTSYSQYQKAVEQLPKNAAAVAFLNLPLVAQWQGLEMAASTYESEIVSLVLNSQGLLAETTFLSNREVASPVQLLSQPVAALRYIPASASLAVTGKNLSNLGDTNLAKFWRQAITTVYGAGEDGIQRFAQPVVEAEKRWGINLGEDILSWVTGEYALAVLSPDNSSSPNWLFVVEKSPELEQGILRLDKLAQAHNLNVSVLPVNEQKVFAWTELTTSSQDKAGISVNAKVKGVHTSLDNYEIFASDLETMNQVLTAPGKSSLVDNSDFNKSIAALPQPNQGYIYIDWDRSQGLLENQLPVLKFVEVLGKPLFNNLRSLTVSSYGNDSGILKGGIFFQLNR
jgi:hypothetical protein